MSDFLNYGSSDGEDTFSQMQKGIQIKSAATNKRLINRTLKWQKLDPDIAFGIFNGWYPQNSSSKLQQLLHFSKQYKPLTVTRKRHR